MAITCDLIDFHLSKRSSIIRVGSEAKDSHYTSGEKMLEIEGLTSKSYVLRVRTYALLISDGSLSPIDNIEEKL